MTIQFLERDGHPKLAYRKTEANEQGAHLPTLMFLGGFKSDMEGTKAEYLEQQCIARGQAYVRFDYSGHGSSEGKFEDGTIGIWRDDALAVFDALTSGDVLLAGSSMGGWISFLVAAARTDRVKGIIGIAAAPDFTKGIEKEMTKEQHAEMQKNGYLAVPNDYSDEPYIFTKALIKDGRENSFLEEGLDLTIPVNLVQGMKDADVEWQTAHRIKNALSKTDTHIVLIEEGDHRLSAENELQIIDEQVQALL